MWTTISGRMRRNAPSDWRRATYSRRKLLIGVVYLTWRDARQLVVLERREQHQPVVDRVAAVGVENGRDDGAKQRLVVAPCRRSRADRRASDRRRPTAPSARGWRRTGFACSGSGGRAPSRWCRPRRRSGGSSCRRSRAARRARRRRPGSGRAARRAARATGRAPAVGGRAAAALAAPPAAWRIATRW